MSNQVISHLFILIKNINETEVIIDNHVKKMKLFKYMSKNIVVINKLRNDMKVNMFFNIIILLLLQFSIITFRLYYDSIKYHKFCFLYVSKTYEIKFAGVAIETKSIN